MSLYGNVQNAANQDKVLSTIADTSQAKEILFVDTEEALLEANRSRGINGPGWWEYYSYVDSSGNTRHKSVFLCALASPVTGDGLIDDDAFVADPPNPVITLVQPVDDTTSEAGGGVAAFTVTGSASVPAATLTYQWQRRATSGSRWTNVVDGGVFSGATTDTLDITGATVDPYDGYQFRVKVNSDNGAEEVISDTVTLTVTA